ncbi:unnamed protein product [Peniophora sp. CBMAI 1063]|nr:unnamed protein product [Peniophora sp. CBMAI 1063]
MSQNQQAEFARGESGTQSPPMQDNAPMGASSIRGGNAGAVPDREQRDAYFNEPSGDTRDENLGRDNFTTSATASTPVRQLNAAQQEREQPSGNQFASSGASTGPFKETTGSGAMRDILSSEERI